MKNQWRLIINGTNDGYTNMAVDKAIMETALVPTVRFYQWSPPAVSIGCFQGLREEVVLEKCRELGIDYVRRITGGGAVFHDKELTYSISIDENNFFIPKDLHQSYEKICQAVILGLKKLGLKAEYVPLNDIAVNNKKISGCAQTRRNGKLLQHGTLLMEVDVEKMFSLLKVPDEKIKDKLISDVKQRVTSLKDQLGREISYFELAEAVKKGFEEYFKIGFEESQLSQEEIILAEKIKNEQFKNYEWNHSR